MSGGHLCEAEAPTEPAGETRGTYFAVITYDISKIFPIGCCKTYKDESLDLDDTDKARIAKYLNDCCYFMPNYEVYNEKYSLFMI